MLTSVVVSIQPSKHMLYIYMIQWRDEIYNY
jgi:hypothetical protein